MNKTSGNRLRLHTNYRNLSFSALRKESILDFSPLRSREMTTRHSIIYNCQRLLCAALMTIAAITATAQSHIYLSPTGNDGNKGTKRAPLYSLQKALEMAISTTAKDTAYIEAAPGDYYMSEGCHITTANTRPIVVRSTGKEKPRFIGGRRVNEWQQQNSTLYTAHIPEAAWGDYTFEQLFINGRRATLARTPNKGFYKIKEATETITDNGKSADETFAATRIEGHEGDLDILEHVWPGANGQPKASFYHKWSNTKMHVDIINKEKNTFNVAGKRLPALNNIGKGTPYFLYDFRHALDAAGEWYMDYSTATLYYKPMQGEDMKNAECIIPTVKRLIYLAGNSEEKIKNISFNGIKFSVSKFNLPRTGHYPSQAAANTDAAIVLRNTDNISFNDCDIEHCGAYALWIESGSSNCKVQRCYINDMGAGGIKIGTTSVPKDISLLTKGNIIDNNIIRDGGKEIAEGVGVHIMHAADNKITHNEISNLRYSGISMGWKWGYGTSMACNNTIAYNHIHHLGWGELSDLGGIYTLGEGTGNSIVGNVIHDIASGSYGGWGIYTDEGSSNITIKENLVYRCHDGAFHQHYGKENIVENNIFAFGKNFQIQTSRIEPHNSFTFRRNIILQKEGGTATGQWFNAKMNISNNIYWSYGNALSFCGKSSSEWKQKREKSALFINPQMKAPLNDDFTFINERAARTIGFKPFDYKKAGVYGSDAWLKKAQEGNSVHKEFLQATGM